MRKPMTGPAQSIISLCMDQCSTIDSCMGFTLSYDSDSSLACRLDGQCVSDGSVTCQQFSQCDSTLPHASARSYLQMGKNAAVAERMPAWSAKVAKVVRNAKKDPSLLTRSREYILLHIPKTGTTFAGVLASLLGPPYGWAGGDLQHYWTSLCTHMVDLPACDRWSTPPTDACRVNVFCADGLPTVCPMRAYHDPWDPTAKGGIGVALFREPVARIVSAYHHDMHAQGFGGDIRALQNAQKHKRFEDFAAIPEVHNCQTKMLLGRQCAARFTITKELFEEAVRVLQGFFFVGLSEEFDLSARLLARKLGKAELSALPNSRAGSYDHQRAPLGANLTWVQALESWDVQLYALARQRFWAESKLYDRIVPSGR